MIKNDWQLRVTQRRIKDFEDALFELERRPESKAQPWLRAAQRESLESELKNLRGQVDEYELLKTGKVALPGLEALQLVPELLIKTRISKGLNQEALAARLGVSKQCIQQYEQTSYANVTLSVAQKVMQALIGNTATTPMAAVKKVSTEKPARSSAGTARKRGTAQKAANKKVAPKRRMDSV
jgi:transcriptional regulator with XRE-family HTH domain